MYRLIKKKNTAIFGINDSYYLLKDNIIFESYQYTDNVDKILFLKQVNVYSITLDVIEYFCGVGCSHSEKISYFLNDPSYYICIDGDTYNLIKDCFDVTGLWYYK